MLDLAYGEPPSSEPIRALVDGLSSMALDGTLYIGYPILKDIDGTKKVDALLTCTQHGVVAFDLAGHRTSIGDLDVDHLEDTQDDIYVSLRNKLLGHRALRRGRELPFEVNVLTLLADGADASELDGPLVATPSTLVSVIAELPALPDHLVEPLNAVIQRTATLRPRKRRTKATTANSRGTAMKRIEMAIANLDTWQKRAAIEHPEGPQRIRGLAGSGKTIVLAQKASFLHLQHPDWTIVVTFNTRSLYQQFISLIQRFSYELANEEPDWEYLRVRHAWGSASTPGVYSEVARWCGAEMRDFGYAKNRYGYEHAFSGVCGELLPVAQEHSGTPPFDAVLIDEAQDFPTEFFKLAFAATREPKRIVWAYDELQNLGDYVMSPAETLFGVDANGEPCVALHNSPDKPRQDIVLPVCYRNTPWALTIAHALGFGIYRADGMVQMFDDTALWGDIGYECVSGRLVPGSNVSLARRDDASPGYFREYLDAGDSVCCQGFASFKQECDWVADSIGRNLAEDELDISDILVIYCEPLGIQKAAGILMRALKNRSIDSHLVGVTTSRDALFYEESIAITSVYRAKGNEAPMVYVMGADSTIHGFELAKRRNILFTAMTRSRGWVRITGVGSDMDTLMEEVEQVRSHGHRLEFRYPTDADVERMRRIHRDMAKDERVALRKEIEGVSRLARRIEGGEIDIASLPDEVRALIEGRARAE